MFVYIPDTFWIPCHDNVFVTFVSDKLHHVKMLVVGLDVVAKKGPILVAILDN